MQRLKTQASVNSTAAKPFSSPADTPAGESLSKQQFTHIHAYMTAVDMSPSNVVSQLNPTAAEPQANSSAV